MVKFFEQGLERHGKKLVIYLRRRDMKPVNPKILWNREPTIIAPCSSLIMCLNFCSLAKMDQNRTYSISIKVKHYNKFVWIANVSNPLNMKWYRENYPYLYLINQKFIITGRFQFPKVCGKNSLLWERKMFTRILEFQNSWQSYTSLQDILQNILILSSL